jgi:hypothetical protein
MNIGAPFLLDSLLSYLDENNEKGGLGSIPGMTPPNSGVPDPPSDPDERRGEKPPRPSPAAQPAAPANAPTSPFLSPSDNLNSPAAAAPYGGDGRMGVPPPPMPPAPKARPVPVMVPLPRVGMPIGSPGFNIPAPPVAVPSWSDLEALGKKAHALLSEAVDKSVWALGEATDWARSLDHRSYQVYGKRTSDLIPWLYFGRTSGFESPDINVKNRGRALYPSPAYGPAELIHSTDRYSVARGAEQMLIDYAEKCKNSGNKINGISPWNPLRPYYMAKAAEEFHVPETIPCAEPKNRRPI